jgi:hypothetical protein
MTAKWPDHWRNIGSWHHAAIFLMAVTIVVIRRPDAVFHPQFFAEDGRVWFADAYNCGWWPALLKTWLGYFQTLPRLGAALALLAPFAFAPLVLNLIAIGLQALPVNLLMSSRSCAWGSLRFRALLAAILLALPNSAEVGVGITDSQWFLALSTFLVVVSIPPRSAVGRAFDILVVLLCGLTGPFCIFLLPIALFLAWRRREGWRWVSVGLLSVLSLVQAWGLLIVEPASRRTANLGLSLTWLVRIVVGQIYLGTLLGSNCIATLSDVGSSICFACVCVGGTAIVISCFLKCAAEMRLFLIFSVLIFSAALMSPQAHPATGVSVWAMLAGMPAIRYWFFPTLAFAWSLLWCVRSNVRISRAVSAALLLVMCIGICRDWRRPAFLDMDFADFARRLEAAPVGTVVTIPENPKGWEMRLVKRTD